MKKNLDYRLSLATNLIHRIVRHRRVANFATVQKTPVPTLLKRKGLT